MKHIRNTSLVILCALLIFSCGGEAKKPGNQEKKSKEQKTEVKNDSSEKETILIHVNAIGESMTEIAFEPKTIDVPANSKIKLIFKNKSSTPGMLHNFVLVELGSGQDIASAGIKAGKENSFAPQDERVIVKTKILDLGESIEIEFDAPDKGSYHYICTFPGHYPNMIGRLNVN